MADIASWQQTLEISPYLLDPNKIATNLYECNLQMFLSLAKGPIPGLDSSIQQRLHTQAQKFSLWGTNFDAQEGGLDERLIGAYRLKNALLPILSGLAETLLTLIRRLNREERLADTISRLQSLKIQVIQWTNKPTLDGSDNELEIQAIDDLGLESDSSSSDELVELEELSRDVQSYNSCLYGLGSVLNEPAEKVPMETDNAKTQVNWNTELLKNTAFPYIASIIEAFPSIDRDLARRLGEANEVRYHRLQIKRDNAATDYNPSTSLNQVSSSFEQSENTAPSTKISSVFDTNRQYFHGLRPESPTSETTFASSVIGGGDSQNRTRGVPKMPEDQPWGMPFMCTVCGETLSTVWSSAQWVRHVYQDLQPYVCTFPRCDSGLDTFTSRRQWANHELEAHRNKLSDLGTNKDRIFREECPFCLTRLHSTRSGFVSHVGRHMQHIACAAIPVSALTSDDEDIETSDDDRPEIEPTKSDELLPDPDIELSISRYGISQVNRPSQGVGLVDVVFVHGLNGDPHNTWTAEKSKIFWPAQLLAPILKEENARILVYGYNAEVQSFMDGYSMDKIHNHAEHLIAELAANRQLRKATEHPIIFVAHSLGGLIVKRALIYSSETYGNFTEHLRSIFVSTYGILFLGTPHTVSGLAKWNMSLSAICDAILPSKAANISASMANNETLFNIDRCFIQISARFHLYFFHEGRPTKLKQGKIVFIVDEESASPNVPDIERAMISADHNHICKFESDSSPGFGLVAEGIQRFSSAAPKTIAARWDAERLQGG